MKSPKMLPWLARKAGISDARAEELWAEAIRHATEKTGWVGTSEYWKAAVARLLELVAAEADVVRLSPVVCLQTRLWMMQIAAWERITLAQSAAWSRLMQQQMRRAA